LQRLHPRRSNLASIFSNDPVAMYLEGDLIYSFKAFRNPVTSHLDFQMEKDKNVECHIGLHG